MLRRGVVRVCAASNLGLQAAARIRSADPGDQRSYEQKKTELELRELQKLAAEKYVSVRPTTNLIADHHDATAAMDKSTVKDKVEAFDGEFVTTKQEMREVMKAKQALRILNIPEAKLYGLRREEVQQAWELAFAQARSEHARSEATAAAEMLHDYVSSDTAREQTREHFTKHINKAKEEIRATLKKDREGSADMVYRGLGFGHLALTGFFTLSIVLMYRYIERHDADLAIVQARRSFAVAVSQATNDEPAPDYQTRYRDTPTTLDEHMAKNRPDITNAQHRALLDQERKDLAAEETLLQELVSDVSAEARARAREADAARRKQLEAALKNASPFDYMEGVVAAAPPPALRDLQRATR